MAETGILAHFRGEPRASQVQALQWVERMWSRADVLVLVAPVAAGKTLIADCISRWVASARSPTAEESSVVVTPSNVLVDQYLQSCRGLDTLRRKSLYMCLNQPGRSCADRAEEVGHHCAPPDGNWYSAGACPYVRDLRRARSSRRLVMTYHALMAHKCHKQALIVDEAHNLIPFLRDLAATRLWAHEVGFPPDVDDTHGLRAWLADIRGPGDHPGLQLLDALLHGRTASHLIDIRPQEWRGSERPCVSLVPLDIQHEASPLWPRQVSKLVLMSATINQLDVRQLGLHRRRVATLELPSEIPVERRPVVYHPVADMSFARRDTETRKLATWLRDELLPAHAGERGLIHCTYAVARILREMNLGPRLVFHGAADRSARLAEWLEPRGPADDRVLVACGLTEGLDLPGKLAEFQLIVNVPRASIDDPAVARQVEDRPLEYEWDTVRRVAQAAGRVCRGADDWGVTIITDASFGAREMQSTQWPRWFSDALRKSPG